MERTPEELEEDVEDLFGMLDMDDSGNVTGDELKLIGTISGCMLTHSQVSQLLQDMKNDEFCVENDGFCIKNDGFCIKK